MEDKKHGKENVKESIGDKKVAADIRATAYGVNADDTKLDTMKKKDHIPYDAKGDPRNAQNTVNNR